MKTVWGAERRKAPECLMAETENKTLAVWRRWRLLWWHQNKVSNGTNWISVDSHKADFQRAEKSLVKKQQTEELFNKNSKARIWRSSLLERGIFKKTCLIISGNESFASTNQSTRCVLVCVDVCSRCDRILFSCFWNVALIRPEVTVLTNLQTTWKHAASGPAEDSGEWRHWVTRTEAEHLVGMFLKSRMSEDILLLKTSGYLMDLQLEESEARFWTVAQF